MIDLNGIDRYDYMDPAIFAVTKGELFKEIGNLYSFDWALPQGWLDEATKKLKGTRWIREDIRFSTVWIEGAGISAHPNDPDPHGPFCIIKEINEALEKAGM